MFPDRDHFGRIFFNQATMSAKGIPQIAVVMGSCTAGGAYVPAMADESIIVRDQGTIFLGGPPLVKAATGEVVSAEELGGADVHSRTSGVTDHYALNDAHALDMARDIVAKLNYRKDLQLGSRTRPIRRTIPANCTASCRLDARTLRRARSDRPHRGRQRVRRVQGALRHDAGSGFARIWGYPVGISPTTASCSAESALKGAHFIELCLPARDPAGVPAEHHRLHGRPEIRSRRHRQGRRQDGHRGRLRTGAEDHRDHRRQLRRRQLRHVRARLFAALPVDVAERPHQRDGRRAGGGRAGEGPARDIEARGETWTTGRRRRSRRRSARSTSARAIPTTPARGCGTTA